MKTALIIIDMINDFVTGKLGFKEAQEIIPNIQRLLAATRTNGVPVIYVCDSHSPDDVEVGVWGQHALAGTESAQVISQLKPLKNEPIVPKQTYSMFFSDEPRGLLKKMGVKELILVGVATDVCVQNSAAGAFFNGYSIIIPEDCVAAHTQLGHKYALGYMKRVFAAKITDSASIIKEWKK